MNEMKVDSFVEAVKASRGSAAELKLGLINIRSELPSAIIFVFEGDDDRGVYYSWVRYIDATFRYEPYTCRGKAGVLKLKEAVDRDAGELKKGVFFFIDRDFDDARGVLLDESIYMTDCYSIENYLVSEDVLEEVLKIEFHCHGHPGVREDVVELFRRTYEKFLAATTDVNRQLHAIRRLGVSLEVPLGGSITRIVTISLDEVERTEVSPSEFLRPIRQITEEELAVLADEFDALQPRERYRGKFALMFFMKWLGILAGERREKTTELFRDLDTEVKVHHGRLSIATLAARSMPPESFRAFFDRIPREA